MRGDESALTLVLSMVGAGSAYRLLGRFMCEAVHTWIFTASSSRCSRLHIPPANSGVVAALAPAYVALSSPQIVYRCSSPNRVTWVLSVQVRVVWPRFF